MLYLYCTLSRDCCLHVLYTHVRHYQEYSMAMRSLNSVITKFDGFDQLIKQGITITKSVAEDIEESEDGSRVVDELRDLMLEYARMERELKQWKSSVEWSKSLFEEQNSGSTRADGRNIAQLFEDHLKELELKNNEEELRNHAEVLDFTQAIWNNHHSVDVGPEENAEDIVLMSQLDQSQLLTCPITKVELVDPVKSKKCGHSFSRKAIEAHINNMQYKARCPVVGCANVISHEQLEADSVLAYKLKKRAK